MLQNIKAAIGYHFEHDTVDFDRDAAEEIQCNAQELLVIIGPNQFASLNSIGDIQVLAVRRNGDSLVAQITGTHRSLRSSRLFACTCTVRLFCTRVYFCLADFDVTLL